MADKLYYYKIYVYPKTGRPVTGIKHHVSPDLTLVREQYEKEARKHYQADFLYMDIWTMDERFLEVIEYKKEKGLE